MGEARRVGRAACAGRRRGTVYGKGYRYPHDFADVDVDQQYLPDALAGRAYYEPSDQGLEIQIGERLQRLRRARLEKKG